MVWPEPWRPAADQTDRFHETFLRQLQLELGPGHVLFGLPARMIGRGDGDDALFEILDGSGRVAVVHLVWSKVRQEPPWPDTTIYQSLGAFADDRMRPEHRDWATGDE